MTERQDRLLANEDHRFFAIDKLGDGLGIIATTERLRDQSIVSFGLPSGPALALNLAQRAHEKRIATNVPALFDPHPSPQGTWPDDHKPLFDYLEAAMAEILFSYTAIEGAMNELIEPTSTYLRRKSGRPPVQLVGAEIERRISLDEKLTRALPAILGKPSPAGGTLWVEYGKLGELRDRLVHLKTLDRKASGPNDETIWGDLLRIGSRSYPDISKRMIEHFYPSERRWFRIQRSESVPEITAGRN